MLVSLYILVVTGGLADRLFQTVYSLYNTHHQDSHHLISIFYDCFCQQCGIGSHAYNILIVIVVGNAMYIHRIGQSLALRCGRSRGKL